MWWISGQMPLKPAKANYHSLRVAPALLAYSYQELY